MSDNYGGSFENCIRLAIEIIQAVWVKWDRPLFRVSATGWAKELGPEKGQNKWRWWGI